MNEKFVFKKPNFGPPPPGYIAGLGRGATGFITRSDLGPSQIANNAKISQAQHDEANLTQNKFDNWEGYSGALFSKNILDEQDRQAQQAYDYCERKMDQRRSKQREQKMKKQLEKYKNSNLPINENFKDLKRQLVKVTKQEWQNIPQSADSSLKKKTRQKYTPTPDSIMVNYLTTENGNTIQQQIQTNQDYRKAKSNLLQSKLNQVQQKQTSVDKVGYMTQLSTLKIDPASIGDYQKAKLLFKSALQSNPKNADLWISASRIQQHHGKLNEARQILKKAVSYCPLNQDIWIQYSRIQTFQNSKNVIIQGLRNIPGSQKLWMYASKLQGSDKQRKIKILRKGLQNNPSSVRLWRQLIDNQSLQEAKKLLYKAVQYIPKQIELWEALCKIQSYQNAKKVLNMARKANPLSQVIWINAAKLQEANFMTEQNYNLRKQKYVQKIQSILVKARQILKKNGKNTTRDEWLQQAYYCQKSENLLTCEALVKISLSYGLNQQQILNTLLKDTKIFEQQRQSLQTVRYLYKHGLILLKDKIMFQKFIAFEQRVQKRRQQQVIQNKQQKNNNSHLKSQLIQALNLGVKLFPQQKKFWLMIIEKYINQNNYQLAQKIIKSAQKHIQSDLLEQVKLCKVKILKRLNQMIQARCQLQILCQQFPKGKSKIQLVKLQFQLQNYSKAWQLCQNFYKDMHVQDIWILAFKILIKLNKSTQAKTLIQKASNLFPNSIKIWKLLIQFQLNNQAIGRARSVLDKALLKNPQQEQLYLIGFQIQYVYGSIKDAQFFLSKALKACPKSAQLWGKAVQIQPNNSKAKKSATALQICGSNQPALVLSVGKVFWRTGKDITRGKKWVSNALESQKGNGDYWCTYLLLLKQHYLMEYKLLWDQFIKSQITQGRIWTNIVQKQPSLNKQEVYEKVCKKLQQQLLRIN